MLNGGIVFATDQILGHLFARLAANHRAGELLALVRDFVTFQCESEVLRLPGIRSRGRKLPTAQRGFGRLLEDTRWTGVHHTNVSHPTARINRIGQFDVARNSRQHRPRRIRGSNHSQRLPQVLRQIVWCVGIHTQRCHRSDAMRVHKVANAADIMLHGDVDLRLCNLDRLDQSHGCPGSNWVGCAGWLHADLRARFLSARSGDG